MVSEAKLAISFDDPQTFFAWIGPGDVIPLGDCTSGAFGWSCRSEGCLMRPWGCVSRGFAFSWGGGSFGLGWG